MPAQQLGPGGAAPPPATSLAGARGGGRASGGGTGARASTWAGDGLHPARVGTTARATISRAARASAASRQATATNSSTGSAGAARGVGFIGSRGPVAAHRPGHRAGRWSPAAVGDGGRLDNSMVPPIEGGGQASGAGGPPIPYRKLHKKAWSQQAASTPLLHWPYSVVVTKTGAPARARCWQMARWAEVIGT